MLKKTLTTYVCEYCGCSCASESTMKDHEKVCGSNPSVIPTIQQSVIGRCFRRGKYDRYFSRFDNGSVVVTEVYSDPFAHTVIIKSEYWDTKNVFELMEEGEEITYSEFMGNLTSLIRKIKKW